LQFKSIGHQSLVISQTGHWALGIGHWASGIGHWSLVISHWSSVISHQSLITRRKPFGEAERVKRRKKKEEDINSQLERELYFTFN
jgi:hypothetical protein